MMASGWIQKNLDRFFSILGEGAKKIGGIHEHFGVGAKIASLPWNPEGMVVISYKEGRGSMIWILLDPDSGDFELMEFDIDGEKSCVIEPQLIDEIDWSAVRPHWLKSHGTVVVLLGSEDNRDTVVGNPAAGEKSIKGLSIYLNSRFWNLTDRDVKVAELRSERKSQWPQSSDDKDDTRRPNNRQIRGAEFYLKSVAAPRGKLQDCGTAMLDDERVLLDWVLMGWRTATNSHGTLRKAATLLFVTTVSYFNSPRTRRTSDGSELSRVRSSRISR